jgi:catechol 2,3-dioxygenase-like lactoylglutathione lyase family enzyme
MALDIDGMCPLIQVYDMNEALAFYRDTLGFVVKENMPVHGARWITLASPEDPEGARISLEPNGWTFVKTYQATLKEKGISLTAFAVADVEVEHARLSGLGVVFKGPPGAGDAAMPKMAFFDDTVGNWIMIYEQPA